MTVHIRWSEGPMDPDRWEWHPPMTVDFCEPVVLVAPHDDGVRVVVASGREFILTPKP